MYYDNPDLTDRLLSSLELALPLRTRLPQRLRLSLREQSPHAEIPPECWIVDVTYAGDSGGLFCHLDCGRDPAAPVFVVSLTHLEFDPRLPEARLIKAYQKHRIKRLRWQDEAGRMPRLVTRPLVGGPGN